MDATRLFTRCREYIVEHSEEVRESGGVDALRDFAITKGLLSDAMREIGWLREQLE